MVEEKESKMKETLKIMGMKSWPYAMSWIVLYLIIFMVINLCTVLLLKSTFFYKSNFFVLFITFGIFYISLIGICFIFASLLEK